MILVGAGQRGRIYADYVVEKRYAEFTAVVEPDARRREDAAAALGIAPDACFSSCDELWKRGKIADAAIIASMDRDHYAQVMPALSIGYDLLLEKPISPNPRECLEISELASKLRRKVIVCHVMRYTPFYKIIKSVLDSGEIGRVMAIRLDENIGNWHMAHSFVRGNWRNTAQSSPIITQKSCHDMDMLTWLAESPASVLASYGSLRYFRPENAPEGSAERCCSCPREPDCRFSAYKCYMPGVGQWPATVLTPDQRESAVLEAIAAGPYGRCVYRCDNDVCDCQIAAIQFENGVMANFVMSGFTNRMNRAIKVMCENGEIEGDDGFNILRVTRFSSNQVSGYDERTIYPPVPESGHGGGDTGLVDDFFASSGDAHSRTLVERSVESHLMASAAEESRLCGHSIIMKEYREKLGA